MLYENDLDKLIKDLHTLDECIEIVFSLAGKDSFADPNEAQQLLDMFALRRAKIIRRVTRLAGGLPAQPVKFIGGIDYGI